MIEFIEVKATKRSISLRKLVYGVGVNDADYMVNVSTDIKTLHCPFYERWKQMLRRCYSEKYQAKQPTYIGCSVCDDWLAFSNFKVWMIDQDWVGKHLDKDILVQGNKVYSPLTCVFVSQSVNNILSENKLTRGGTRQGVCFHKPMGKFLAKINIHGKKTHIGYFSSEEDACQS